MSKFSERFKELRKSRSLTQQQLADYLKISKSSVNMYERGEREPSLETLEMIADYFNVDMDFLLGKADIANKIFLTQEKSNISSVIPQEKIYNIPVYATVSAGLGALAEDEVVEYMPMLIDNPYDVADTFGLKVRGDSMYPKIEDGDIIVVRRQTSVDSGTVAVMLLDGEEGLVKKVIYDKHSIELHSFNPEYKTRIFEGAEVQRLKVVGKVLKVVKTL